MKEWWSVSLLVPRAFEEALSNFLLEQGDTGIEAREEGSNQERLKAYFRQDGKEKTILRNTHRYLTSLQRMAPELSHCQIETASVDDQDWGENWKRFFKPEQVTSKVIVKPPWIDLRRREDDIVIDIIPAMAFGTGTHASTQLCIQALEKRLNRRGLSVLDVGAGSGILSIAAAKLGAREVVGFDPDVIAVESARENVKQNAVAGSVRIRKASIGQIRQRFEVVVANIDLRNLKRMRRPLLRRVKPRGFLILSGILASQGERLRQLYLETRSFEWSRIIRKGEWVCLTLKKKS